MDMNLIGKKFGKLTVTKILGRNRIECKCECGSVKDYNADNVIHGKQKSCGCSRRHPRPDIQKNVVGKRFGKLVVIEELGYGRVLCKCDCGNTKNVNKGHLLHGEITSCGCVLALSAEKNKQPFLFDNTNIAKLTATKATKRSKSGVRGVCWSEQKGKWRANIGLKNQKIDLGYFSNKADAIAARKAAEEKYYKPIINEWEKDKAVKE